MADRLDVGRIPYRHNGGRRMSTDDIRPPDTRAARLRELRALAAAGATPQELAIHLAASGYDPERAAILVEQLAGDHDADDAPEKDDAVSLDRPAADSVTRDEAGGSTLRVWAPFERARFSPEAWGQLLHLRADGMSDAEFEHLVDRALLQLDGRVGPSELRALLGDAVDMAVPPTVH